MYLNSSGFCAIGRALNVPFQLVHHWIKKAGEIVEEGISKVIFYFIH
jgi:transposase-like protein